MVKLMTSVGYTNHVAKVRELEMEVRKLQSQVGDVTTQSNETWHDNAPYSILVEELRMANRRLTEAHDFLNGYQILEYPLTLSEQKVQYGAKVSLKMDGRPQEFNIVGYGEDDFDNGCIVYACPLAKILMGRSKGERFQSEINRSPHVFYIEDISPLAGKLLLAGSRR